MYIKTGHRYGTQGLRRCATGHPRHSTEPSMCRPRPLRRLRSSRQRRQPRTPTGTIVLALVYQIAVVQTAELALATAGIPSTGNRLKRVLNKRQRRAGWRSVCRRTPSSRTSGRQLIFCYGSSSAAPLAHLLPDQTLPVPSEGYHPYTGP